jgi:hypothetical protein
MRVHLPNILAGSNERNGVSSDGLVMRFTEVVSALGRPGQVQMSSPKYNGL